MVKQFSAFRRPRSSEEHDVITEKLVASVLLGSPDPWDKPELRAFREGFNVDLGDRTLLQVCFSSSVIFSP
jgi:hypothetical protein